MIPATAVVVPGPIGARAHSAHPHCTSSDTTIPSLLVRNSLSPAILSASRHAPHALSCLKRSIEFHLIYIKECLHPSAFSLSHTQHSRPLSPSLFLFYASASDPASDFDSEPDFGVTDPADSDPAFLAAGGAALLLPSAGGTCVPIRIPLAARSSALVMSTAFRSTTSFAASGSVGVFAHGAPAVGGNDHGPFAFSTLSASSSTWEWREEMGWGYLGAYGGMVCTTSSILVCQGVWVVAWWHGGMV